MFLNKFFLNLNFGLISKGKKRITHLGLGRNPAGPSPLPLSLSFFSLLPARPACPAATARAARPPPPLFCAAARLGPHVSGSSTLPVVFLPRRPLLHRAARVRPRAPAAAAVPPRLVAPSTVRPCPPPPCALPPRSPPSPCAAVESVRAAPSTRAARSKDASWT